LNRSGKTTKRYQAAPSLKISAKAFGARDDDWPDCSTVEAGTGKKSFVN